MISGRVIRITVGAASAALLLAIPAATASASQIFGSDLTETAVTGPVRCPNPACTDPTDTILPSSVKDGNSFPLASPISGVIVGFGIKASAAETVTFRLGRVGDAPAFNGTASSTGPTATIPEVGTFSIPARMPVSAGDSVGFDFSQAAGMTSLAASSSPGCFTNARAFFYSPPLVDGGPSQAPQSNTSCELLVNAVVEADADSDGFGDETQDKCVGTTGVTNGCPNTLKAASAAQAGKSPRVTVTATVPGAGTLEAGDVTDASIASDSALSLTPVSQTVTSTNQQTVPLTLALTKRAKKKFKRKHKLSVQVKVSYRPPGGTTGPSQVLRVKLKSKKKKK